MYKIININNFSKNEYDNAYSLMSDEKKAKINRFCFDDDKKRSVFGEMLAKSMISESLSVPIESIVLKADKNGKPYAEGLDIHFNISHSADLVICAVEFSPVGIDIEKIAEVKNNLISFVCTENEKNYVLENDAQKQNRFFEIWTAKEAYVKFKGSGIQDIKKVNTLSAEFKKHIETLICDGYAISIYK